MRNDLLYLNKTFKEKDRERNSFPISVYQSKPVELDHLKNILKSLQLVKIHCFGYDFGIK